MNKLAGGGRMKQACLALVPRRCREWWWGRRGCVTEECGRETLPKLHLGCGETYLTGYVNIDYPPSEHTAQVRSVADVQADICTLQYPPLSVREIRLHHVFEHFDRGVALRLLLDWYDWLAVGGRLVIETPDFEKCVRAWVKTHDEVLKMRLMRHVFGSQEAVWAVHRDGWYQDKFAQQMSELGFGDFAWEHGGHHGLYNITVHARKLEPLKSRTVRELAAEGLLRLSMVDDSDIERRMLKVWVKALKISQ